MEEKKTFSTTDFYLLLGMLIWGSDFIFAKIALREISPLNYSAMRTILAAAVLFPVFLRQEKKRSVSARHFLWLVGLSLLGILANRILFSVGLNLTTASNSSLIMSTSPIFVLIVSLLFARGEVSRKTIVGILLSFLGVFLVIWGKGEGLSLSSTLQGDLIMVVTAFTWAAFTVLAKRLLKEHSSLKVTTYIMLIGGVCFLPFLPNEKAGWGGISGLAWFCVLYVAVMGNCLAYFLWVRGIAHVGPMRTMLYQYLIPVTTILWAALFLQESLTAVQTWGMAAVFSGIFLARSA